MNILKIDRWSDVWMVREIAWIENMDDWMNNIYIYI